MRPYDVEGLGTARTLLVKRSGDDDFDPGADRQAEVALHQASGDRALLVVPGQVEHLEVVAASRESRRTLRSVVEANLPSVCWVVGDGNVGGAPTRLLRVHEFPDEMALLEPWRIGADDKVLEQIAARSASSPTAAELPDWLVDQFVLAPHPLDRGARVLASAGADADLQRGALQLYGADMTATITRSDDGRLVVDRLGPRRVPHGLPIVVVRGEIAFVDTMQATTAAAESIAFGRPTSEYLRLWQRYDELESEQILRDARSAGSIAYAGCEQVEGQDHVRYRFMLLEPARLGAFLAALGRADVAVAQQEPGFLTNEGDPDPRDELLSGRVSAYDTEAGAWIEMVPAAVTAPSSRPKPGHAGVLHMSLRGYETQRARRERARAEVLEGRSGIPRLAQMVQGETAWQARRRARRLPALTPAAKAALGGPPTNRQEEALDAALNTPDIAVIQGPPGTGKTGVIAALAVRLTELAEDRPERTGHTETTLLTSFQREAVATVGRRTNVMGFPARIVISQDRRQVAERVAIDWAQGVANTVEAARTGAAESEQPALVHARRAIRGLTEAYRLAPGARSHGIETIDEVLDRAGGYLDRDTVERLHRIRHDIARQRGTGKSRRDEIIRGLRVARGLRVSATAFEDDGPARSAQALDALAPLGVLTARDRKLLTECARAAGSLPRRLQAAANLRGQIIDRLNRLLDDLDVAAADVDLVAALDQANAALAQRVREGGHAEAAILADYLDALRNDPAAVELVHRRYSRVVAATCQGSRERTLSDQRHRGELAAFDVVIVDEAARATPLDLMIPLSAARRQVILVGDHRQLPHLVDHALEGEAATSAQAAAELRQSMFERLFISLRQQELRDGVRRVVTLDRQFRMHPRLGSFVNETFYAPYGESLTNGTPEEKRLHDVPRFLGRVAAWEDVPSSEGEEEGRVHRPAEARAAVDLMKEVSRDGDPELEIAIVTFYRQQLGTIEAICRKDGVAVGSLKGGDFQFVDKLAKRVSIGTVDAFQGGEFDVVILSPVRSNSAPVRRGSHGGRRRYGFLTIENRACVAMSRARRLLLVAGDRDFASDAWARRWITPFARLSAFCDAEEGHARERAA
jgi:hypothetical protein